MDVDGTLVPCWCCSVVSAAAATLLLLVLMVSRLGLSSLVFPSLHGLLFLRDAFRAAAALLIGDAPTKLHAGLNIQPRKYKADAYVAVWLEEEDELSAGGGQSSIT